MGIDHAAERHGITPGDSRHQRIVVIGRRGLPRGAREPHQHLSTLAPASLTRDGAKPFDDRERIRRLSVMPGSSRHPTCNHGRIPLWRVGPRNGSGVAIADYLTSPMPDDLESLIRPRRHEMRGELVELGIVRLMGMRPRRDLAGQ